MTQVNVKDLIFKGKICYEEWEGTRRFGKYVTCEDYCLIIGDWCYIEGGKRKFRYGEHVNNVEIYKRAPKNTAKTFDRIKAKLPRKYRLNETVNVRNVSNDVTAFYEEMREIIYKSLGKDL